MINLQENEAQFNEKRNDVLFVLTLHIKGPILYKLWCILCYADFKHTDW